MPYTQLDKEDLQKVAQAIFAQHNIQIKTTRCFHFKGKKLDGFWQACLLYYEKGCDEAAVDAALVEAFQDVFACFNEVFDETLAFKLQTPTPWNSTAGWFNHLPKTIPVRCFSVGDKKLIDQIKD